MKISVVQIVKKVGERLIDVAVSWVLWGATYLLLFCGQVSDQKAVELYLGLALLMIVGFLTLRIDFRNRRSRWCFGIAVPAILLGIGTVCVYGNSYAVLMWTCLLAAFVLSLAIGVLLFTRSIKNLTYKKDIWLSRLHRCFYRIMSVFACAFLVIMLVVCVSSGRLEKALDISFEKTSILNEQSADDEYFYEENKSVVPTADFLLEENSKVSL